MRVREERETYVEDVGDRFVIRNVVRLPLFDQCFELSERQGVGLLSDRFLLLVFG
jgi:hypothetical protein